MHFLEKFSPLYAWIGAVILFGVITLFPGSPFSAYLILPVILCAFFPAHRQKIVFAATLFLGIFILNNFFALHIYGRDILDPFILLFQEKGEALSYSVFMASLLAVAGYLLLNMVMFFFARRFFSKFSFPLSLTLVFIYMFLFWLSCQWLSLDSFPSIVFAMIMLMLGRHCFYFFNYLRFFRTLPQNCTQCFALFQPFWFLNFEIPENPDYEVEKQSIAYSAQATAALHILISTMGFKILLIVFTMLAGFILKGELSIYLSAEALEKELFFPLFENWRNTPVAVLYFALFSYAFSYLMTTFFIYGRVMIALAKLCGFNLPDYIDSPWKSHSFADFFSRTMYYYNLIIVNHFFFPAVEWSRRFNLKKEWRVFICLNWALIFGGFFARFLKDLFRIYRRGFFPTIDYLTKSTLFYLIVLSLAVNFSIIRNRHKKVQEGNIFKMLLFVFFYSLIMPFNLSRYFGERTDIIYFYMKLLSFGLLF